MRDLRSYFFDDYIFYNPDGRSLGNGTFFVDLRDRSTPLPYAAAGGVQDKTYLVVMEPSDLFDDFVITADGRDKVEASAGDNLITTEGGDDHVKGGAGDDRIYLGNGSDTAYGGDGDDFISADAWIEYKKLSPIDIGPVSDFGLRTDLIFQVNNREPAGGGEVPKFFEGIDRIYGGAGNDILFGGLNADLIYGGDGDDVIDPGARRTAAIGEDTALFNFDRVYGGAGADVFYLAPESLDLDGASVTNLSEITGNLSSFATGSARGTVTNLLDSSIENLIGTESFGRKLVGSLISSNFSGLIANFSINSISLLIDAFSSEEEDDIATRDVIQVLDFNPIEDILVAPNSDSFQEALAVNIVAIRPDGLGDRQWALQFSVLDPSGVARTYAEAFLDPEFLQSIGINSPTSNSARRVLEDVVGSSVTIGNGEVRNSLNDLSNTNLLEDTIAIADSDAVLDVIGASSIAVITRADVFDEVPLIGTRYADFISANRRREEPGREGEPDFQSGGSARIFGFAGDDDLRGSQEGDEIYGGDGDDVIYSVGASTSPRDSIFGGLGNDTVFAGARHPDPDPQSDGLLRNALSAFGGLGSDIIDFTFSQTGIQLEARENEQTIFGADIDGSVLSQFLLEGFEQFIGSNATDEFRLGDLSVATGIAILGAGGDDVIITGAGSDILSGGDGDDRLDGGPAEDLLFGGPGADLFVLSDDIQDIISDFQEGSDLIDLSALNLVFLDLEISYENENKTAIVSVGDRKIVEIRSLSEIVIDLADFVFGGSDNVNEIFDGSDKELMRGEDGSDLFILRNDGRLDAIKHFELGVDKIDVSAFGAAGISDLLIENVLRRNGETSWVKITDAAGDPEVLLRFNDMRETDAAVLSAENFIFESTSTAAPEVQRILDGLEVEDLRGAPGSDLFVMSNDNVRDLVRNFQIGNDLIDVSALGATNINDLTVSELVRKNGTVSWLQVADADGDAEFILRFQGDTPLLETSLTEADFLFA